MPRGKSYVGWAVLLCLALALGHAAFVLAQAFLAHLLDPRTDQTVYEAMVEHGALKQLGAGEAGGHRS